MKSESLDVVGYSDSDHVGDKDDLKSTSGFVFLMAGGAISWSSSKQTEATLSTMQSEFIALSYATTHAVWLRDLIRCTQVVPSVERPMPIFCDNSAAVFFAKNNKRSSSSKQIELKFLHVRKKTEEKKVVIEDIRTTEMIADPLTKPVPVKVFNKHVAGMGLADSFDSIA